MQRLPQILVCDDDQTFALAIKQYFKGKMECRLAANGDEALIILKKQAIDVLILDVQMRTPDEGLRYLPQFKAVDENLNIIMASGKTDFHHVREAMRLGAVDYFPKDISPEELAVAVSRVLERRKLLQQRSQQNFEVMSHQKKRPLIGNSPQILALKKMIERIALSPANVVITGETGTGKEVVARQLRKPLPDGTLVPFVAIDSATIQSSTAESTLFGHEKGAFTGALQTTKGIFEEANGGIVYFDEIANMPLDIQSKLLRVLQEKEVTRLGSSRVIQLEFRVVCATNRNLEDMVTAGQFKDDLLQRLNVLPLSLPPLRDRKDDIPLLIEHFVQLQAPNPAETRFTPEAIETLKAYSWPGNIRELGNVVAYVCTMSEGPEIDVADLPPKIRDAATSSAARASATDGASGGTFYERVAEFEKQLLANEYGNHGGNISKMALILGMDRSHLYSKLKEFSLHKTKGS